MDINKIHEPSFQVLCTYVQLNLVVIQFNCDNKPVSNIAYDGYGYKHDYQDTKSLVIVSYYCNDVIKFRIFKSFPIDTDFVTSMTKVIAEKEKLF